MLRARVATTVATAASHNTHFSSFSPTITPLHRRNFKPLSSTSSTQSQPSIKIMSTASQIIEHIVLFKVKPDVDPSKVDAMVNNLNSLVSLDPVLHITSGPITRTRSASPLVFTHMLHSRYKSKSDLTAYAQHPSHVGVVKDYVTPVVDDVMAFDWVADDVTGPIVVPSGSAMRLTFLKLKENLDENEKNKVLGVLSGVKEKFGAIEQYTYGENFSLARGKGFSIGSIAVFRGLSEMDGLDAESEIAKEEKDKVRDSLDGLLVIDYMVPSAQSARI